ncbi:MAG: hypothetical protein FJ284_06900 [Planctomycetes bacterium]|nr:hypothetical protein [Planctomycetota bacterium]
MNHSTWRISAVLCCATLVATGSAMAAGLSPSEKVFPDTAVAWLSVASPREFRARFDRSTYGRLLADPAMQAFVDGVKEQVSHNGKQRLAKLGLTLEDLAEVVGGEIAAAAIEPEDGRLATVLLVDTTGCEDKARGLVETLGKRLLERKAEKVTVPGAPAELVVYQLPAEDDERQQTSPRDRRVAFALAASALVVGDDAMQVGQAFAVLQQGRADSLSTLAAFKAVEQRSAGAVPAAAGPLRWFVKPLPFAGAWQKANPPREKRKGPDYVAILGRQGFDAVQAAGGVLVFSEGAHSLRHHSFIYAPPLAGREPDSPDRYNLAARMLRFPVTKEIRPPDWVPGDVGGWTALHWDVQTAFTAVESLVDDVVGDKGVYDDVIASLKEDPDGPQIDVEKDLVACLGKRITVISGHVEPLSIDADRLVIAIECADEPKVAATIAKVMNADGEMQKIELGGQAAWELVDRSHAIPSLEVETPGGAVTHADEQDEAARRRQKRREKDEKLLPHSTVAVARGHLLIASHRDILERVLTSEGGSGRLATTDEYKILMEEVSRQAPGGLASRSFGREDVSIRPTYELLRQGSMPKARSVLGQLLNGLLGDGKPGSVREQKVDGSKLPEFEAVRKYFGTVGTAVEVFPDGWRLTGLSLPRAGQPEPEVARTPAAPVGR